MSDEIKYRVLRVKVDGSISYSDQMAEKPARDLYSDLDDRIDTICVTLVRTVNGGWQADWEVADVSAGNARIVL